LGLAEWAVSPFVARDFYPRQNPWIFLPDKIPPFVARDFSPFVVDFYTVIYVETQNRRKPLNAFFILYNEYIHFPAPTGWEHQPPDLHAPT